MPRVSAGQIGRDGKQQEDIDAQGGTGALLLLEHQLAVQLREHDQRKEPDTEQPPPPGITRRFGQG